jgi:hypothetical protein
VQVCRCPGERFQRTHRSFAKKDKLQKRTSEALGKRCVKDDRAMMAGEGHHVTQWAQWVYASSSPNSVMWYRLISDDSNEVTDVLPEWQNLT